MICDVCKNGLEGMWDPGRTERLGLVEGTYFRDDDIKNHGKYLYGHHKTQDSFLASIREGCLICHQFSSYPNTNVYNSNIDQHGYFSVFFVWQLGEWPLFYKDFRQMRVFVANIVLDFEFILHGIPTYDKQLNFDFGPSTNDPMTWSRIDNWMKTCLESHALCMQTNVHTSYRPTRLIELTESKTFRLVNGAECLPTTQYVALSYCWGSKPAGSLLRLLQSTIDRLGREQPIDILPKTFRDAMSIAQHFGIKYIWIDRLCIFQDSAEDWSKEASTMQDVYRYAKFSVSALGAEDDDGGCFFQRDPAKTGPTIVRFRVHEDDDERAFRSVEEKSAAWNLYFDREPLLQRAWVVQERLLATRTLYFGSKQVLWECRQATCSECHPEGGFDFSDFDGPSELALERRKRRQSLNLRSPPLWKQLLDAPPRIHSSSAYDQLFMDWTATVEYYAERQLTQADDKLVALSGLANIMKARLGQLKPGTHRYLAGLWEDKLLETLVWRTNGRAKRTPEYRAPSWSWACVDGHISFPNKHKYHALILSGGLYPDDIVFSYVLSVETAYLGSDDTGKVRGGELTLKGPYMYLSADIAKHPHPYYKSKKAKGVTGGHGRHLPMAGNTFFDTLQDARESAIAVWICARPIKAIGIHIMGLLLAPLGDNTYQRLGIACYQFLKGDYAKNYVQGFSEGEFRIR